MILVPNTEHENFKDLHISRQSDYSTANSINVFNVVEQADISTTIDKMTSLDSTVHIYNTLKHLNKFKGMIHESNFEILIKLIEFWRFHYLLHFL